MTTHPPTCKHGKPHFCGLCEAEKAPKCKHGNPWFCGFCEAEKREQTKPKPEMKP